MSTQQMKVAEIHKKDEKIKLTKMEIPKPRERQVRIKVIACGMSRMEEHTRAGLLGGKFPIIPGHEIAGYVDEIGPAVTKVKKGDRVALGWFGGNCGKCLSCRSNQPILCENLKITGVTHAGGYAEYVVALETALARIPDSLSMVDAAPLVVSGMTAFNALRHSKVKAGEIVVVVGLGGVGHLCVQFAQKMGFYVVAMSKREEKRDLAKKLGAYHFINCSKTDGIEELKKMGGAKLILWTTPKSENCGEMISALAVKGKLMILSIMKDKISFDPLKLEMKRASISAWFNGDSRDTEDTLKFAAMTGIRPVIEVMALDQVQEAFAKMESSKCCCKAVLKMSEE